MLAETEHCTRTKACGNTGTHRAVEGYSTDPTAAVQLAILSSILSDVRAMPRLCISRLFVFLGLPTPEMSPFLYAGRHAWMDGDLHHRYRTRTHTQKTVQGDTRSVTWRTEIRMKYYRGHAGRRITPANRRRVHMSVDARSDRTGTTSTLLVGCDRAGPGRRTARQPRRRYPELGASWHPSARSCSRQLSLLLSPFSLFSFP